jgi:hypothetical protein
MDWGGWPTADGDAIAEIEVLEKQLADLTKKDMKP